MLRDQPRSSDPGGPRSVALIPMRAVVLLRLERILFVVGGMLLAAFAVARIHGVVSAHRSLQAFEVVEQANGLQANGDVDVRNWSTQRVREYVASLVGKADPPLAVLRIPKLQLEVPIFDGTDELTLNRGAGRIIGTARLGEVGNVGIAGHRDGFFRGLKDIDASDTLELRLPGRTERYVVTGIEITTPEDVSVLRPTAKASLTLVTCYPFYFVGDAPQRFIVHASIRGADESSD